LQPKQKQSNAKLLKKVNKTSISCEQKKIKKERKTKNKKNKKTKKKRNNLFAMCSTAVTYLK